MSLNTFILSKSFPPCPIPNNQVLPFEIDEMAFSLWFNNHLPDDDLAKCKMILYVLQSLNHLPLSERKIFPGRTRLFFVDKMGATLIASATKLLALPNTLDSPDEETTDDMPTSEISVWSALELANAYALLSQEDWFLKEDYYSKEEKTAILSNGIQVMGRALLYTYQAYSRPHVDFWGKCFQFYRHARIYRLTEVEFNPDAKIIDNAFKQVMVFALSNTNQFTPSEMRSVYELLGHYASHTGLLQSVPIKKFSGIPSIHLKRNEPPTILDEETVLHDPDRIYIATVTVASKILEATYDRRARHIPTDRLMLLRLAKTLTLNEQRKHVRESVDGKIHFGIMGFDKIIKFLNHKEIEHQNILAKTGLFDPSRPGEIRDLDFEIIPNLPTQPVDTLPESAFQIIEFTDSSDIWDSNDHELLERNIQMLDKSDKGFGLLWTDSLIKPKVGGIIGVMHKQLSIGLIRWLARSKETGMFMGVETMVGNCTTVKVYNPGYPNDKVSAIFLTYSEQSRQSYSLVMLNTDFRPTEFVFVQKNHRNIRYRLTKQLHLTSLINHMEVVRSY